MQVLLSAIMINLICADAAGDVVAAFQVYLRITAVSLACTLMAEAHCHQLADLSPQQIQDMCFTVESKEVSVE